MIQFIKKAVSAGIPFGLGAGLLIGLVHGAEVGLAAGGVAALLSGPVVAWAFGNYSEENFGVSDDKYEGEPVVRQGSANHRLKGEHRGGWLILTRQRLVFEPHSLNVQDDSVEIPVEEIDSVAKARSMGIIPNRFLVRHTDSSGELFTVSGRNAWIECLQEVGDISIR